MGIDAQRPGASELPVRAVEVRRGRIAYPLPSGCPGTPWYARREFWAGQLAEKVHSSAQHDEGDPGVDRPERGSASERSRATPVSPAFWAVQSSPNGRWQSPAFWAVQPSPNGRWQSPAFWAVQPSPNGRWQSPAFWAVQPSPNGRWQSPARPMRPSGCGGTWTAVPRLGRGRGQAGGPSGPASVAATGGIRRSGSSLRRLDDVHRHRLRRRALHTAPRRPQRGHLYFHHGLLAPNSEPWAWSRESDRL